MFYKWVTGISAPVYSDINYVTGTIKNGHVP